MPNPTAAMLVIGDEILSGRTRDANLHHIAGALTAAGIDLVEARVVSDDHARIVAAVNDLRARADHLFTSGGIGPTHDDITADAIADAMGVGIAVREDARVLLAAHYRRTGLPLTDARLRMARIPDGAVLIDNPVSAAPGFSIGNVHVMAGVPSIFAAMAASVLARIGGGVPLLTRSLRVDRPESELADPVRAVAGEFADLALGSYPFIRDGAFGAVLVVRGRDADRLDAAIAALRAAFPDAVEE